MTCQRLTHMPNTDDLPSFKCSLDLEKVLLYFLERLTLSQSTAKEKMCLQNSVYTTYKAKATCRVYAVYNILLKYQILNVQ